MNYPKNRYTGEHPWMNKDWLYNEYIIKDKASIEIAREWNCSQNTIQCWLLKHNIKKPITKHILAYNKPYQTFEYLYQMHIVNHMSMSKIAKLNNISHDTVRRNLKRVGINYWTINKIRKLSQDDINKIIELYKLGLSCNRIGELYNVRHKRIASILRKNNIEVRSISEMILMINGTSIVKNNEFNDYDFMFDLYWRKNWTLYEMGTYFGGIDYGTVRRQLIKLGINLRSVPRNMFRNTDLEILKRSLRRYSMEVQVPLVFKRDNYQCSCCHKSFPDVYLNAHHKIPFSGIINKIILEHNELDINKIEDKLKMFDLIINDKTFNNLDNIITLCLDCHKQVHYNK